jgi:hypothetical protein
LVPKLEGNRVAKTNMRFLESDCSVGLAIGAAAATRLPMALEWRPASTGATRRHQYEIADRSLFALGHVVVAYQRLDIRRRISERGQQEVRL